MLDRAVGRLRIAAAKSSFAIHATIAEHYFGGASYPPEERARLRRRWCPLIEAQRRERGDQRGGGEASCCEGGRRLACAWPMDASFARRR